jgi:glucose/arabinose dehydrogenase
MTINSTARCFFFRSRRLAVVLFATPALALSGVVLHAQPRDVARLYNQHCAGCHGDDLQGGQTESLLDDHWLHGNGDDETLFRIIRDGDELNGMPPMKGDLTDPEIRALVVFIREKAAQAKRANTVFAKTIENQIVKSRAHSFRLSTVVAGLSTPWSVAWLPDGRMLVTELPGGLRVVERGRLNPAPVAGTPRVRYKGQGGMMEVALHPGYKTNGWIYLAYTEAGVNSETRDGGMTVVVRGRLKDHRWTDEQTIFRAPLWSYRPGGVHFGCRLVFDDAGHLFFPIGERGHMHDAQDLSRPNGKVHRVFEDGRIPPDNPFVGVSNAMSSIWSYGHRNPQGLVRHPVTGELWSTEHGPRGGDELNLVRKALNYGWPIITYGMNYNGTPITALTAKEGLEQPVIHWTPSIAVCGIDFYRGDKFPRWKNQLFVTGLASEEFRRVKIEGHRVVEQEVVFKGIGRVRHVATGPDGLLYVVLNKPDKVVRLEPVTK